ncbi:hypothetical protein ACFU8W_45495 [Streptomyces sp. NPDC057565]|uniref:hypothetical protein n=1 Tax=Streptomyces sp. NPDC057565 TaxID=3346169 RepID=UPI0036A4A907
MPQDPTPTADPTSQAERPPVSRGEGEPDPARTRLPITAAVVFPLVHAVIMFAAMHRPI